MSAISLWLPDSLYRTVRELADKEHVSISYHHRILGLVKVVYAGGFCDLGDSGKAEVLQAMRHEALVQGGNAVIYADSIPPDNATKRDRCSNFSKGAKDGYGQGWAVVIQP